jgi:hypothetical protein
MIQEDSHVSMASRASAATEYSLRARFDVTRGDGAE